MSMPCIWRTVTTQARAARPRVAASGAAVRYATFMLRIITATREIRNPVVACCRALKLRVARAYSRGEDNGASMKAALALWCYGTLILTAGCGGDATGTGGDHHPVRLAFVVQPNASSAGISLAPSVEIAVQDAQGQLDTTATTEWTPKILELMAAVDEYVPEPP